MSVKLVFLAFSVVIYQANGQFQFQFPFPFGNGGFGQGGSGLLNLPNFFSNMFRPQQQFRPPQINIPFFGSNQGISSLFPQISSQFRPRPPINPNYEPVNQPQPIFPPTNLEDVHPNEYVTPEEIEGERPTFPQSRPEISEPVAVVEINEPGVSAEVIAVVPSTSEEQPIYVSEENLFQIPEEQPEENLFEPEEEDIQEEDIQDIVDENEIQQVPLISPSVEIEEELPQDLPQEFIR